MRYIILISVLSISGCSSITICGERTYEFEVPSTVPFLNGAFRVKRSSDHVDCERDPEERGVMGD